MYPRSDAATTSSTSDAGNVVVISLDFDGCGDILTMDMPAFAKQFYGLPVSNRFGFNRQAKLKEMTLKFCLGQREVLERYLDNIVRAAEDKYGKWNLTVALIVGSARQDISMDKEGEATNQNGSCFQGFEELAAKKGWVYIRFLLPDKYYKLTFMSEDLSDPRYDFSNCTMVNPRCTVDDLWPQLVFQDNKVNIIDAQLEYIDRVYSGKRIEFHFIDDDLSGHKILPSLKQHFTNPAITYASSLSLHLAQYERNYNISDWRDQYSSALSKVVWTDESLNDCAKMHSVADIHFAKAPSVKQLKFFNSIKATNPKIVIDLVHAISQSSITTDETASTTTIKICRGLDV